MSAEELSELVGMLRQGGPDLGVEPAQARRDFEEMMKGIPTPDDVAFSEIELAGRPALASLTPGASQGRTLLYLHGGAYVIGSPWGYRSLASAVARACGARGVSFDYRLAPEHPFPAAVEDSVAAYSALLDQGHAPGSIAIAGDSAGGGLTISTLVEARRQGLPMPACALVISPWVDLACELPSIAAKAAEDPALDRPGLLVMAERYLQKAKATAPLASPIHADLTGLPPLLIQVGSAEILLDDAVRLAGVAGAAGVETRLEVWPHMPHVWHAFAFMLSEGRDALKAAGDFISGRFSAG